MTTADPGWRTFCQNAGLSTKSTRHSGCPRFTLLRSQPLTKFSSSTQTSPPRLPLLLRKNHEKSVRQFEPSSTCSGFVYTVESRESHAVCLMETHTDSPEYARSGGGEGGCGGRASDEGEIAHAAIFRDTHVIPTIPTIPSGRTRTV